MPLKGVFTLVVVRTKKKKRQQSSLASSGPLGIHSGIFNLGPNTTTMLGRVTFETKVVRVPVTVLLFVLVYITAANAAYDGHRMDI